MQTKSLWRIRNGARFAGSPLSFRTSGPILIANSNKIDRGQWQMRGDGPGRLKRRTTYGLYSKETHTNTYGSVPHHSYVVLFLVVLQREVGVDVMLLLRLQPVAKDAVTYASNGRAVF